MYFIVKNLTVNGDFRSGSIVDDSCPVLSWAAEHSKDGTYQSAYHIVVQTEEKIKWDSGWVADKKQSAVYAGEPFQTGEELEWTLVIRDNEGNESESASGFFTAAHMDEWKAQWITTPWDTEREPRYFQKKFSIEKSVKKANLYVSGIGFQYVTLNGEEIDDAYLQPAISNYGKKCYYVALPVEDFLHMGENTLEVIVGDGWRKNIMAHFSSMADAKRDLFGKCKLTAELRVEYEDGEVNCLYADESWLCGRGGIVNSSLFDGETFDERVETTYTDHAVLADEPAPVLQAQTIQPILAQDVYAPVMKTKVEDGYVFDFGTNIAGIVEVLIPAGMPEGNKVSIYHVENILPDGAMDPETLRGITVVDTFISNGADYDRLWQPKFVYHGFRYIYVKGWHTIPDIENFMAIAFHTDIKNNSYFRCGNPLVNQLQKIIVQTEKNNLHSIATDCPQRDERMGWMNDATVRFEETPYNFNVRRLFEKIVDDITTEQSEDGAITCTAPYVFGERPADPVCSSYLIAAWENYLHYGDTTTIAKYYDNFKAWNECLKAYSEDGIVTYTHYGDWAGPADYCPSIDDPHSTVTPGILMSTGYHYFNYLMLARFAEILGKEQDAAYNKKEAERVQKAFLAKWWNEKTGLVASGSQGCQAFALWLGILPEAHRELAAQRLHEAVEKVGYRITTGNLTTRYLMDMLAAYGYLEDAWKILTREEYPSWGYMLQNGATTVWERFEFKRGSGMNSHDHPMYGAVGYWLYSYLAGVKPGADGWQNFIVQPYLPEKLLYAEAGVDTPYGMIYVKWQKQMGQTDVLVNVPFGTTATIKLPWGEEAVIESGYHNFHQKWEE